VYGSKVCEPYSRVSGQCLSDKQLVFPLCPYDLVIRISHDTKFIYTFRHAFGPIIYGYPVYDVFWVPF